MIVDRLVKGMKKRTQFKDVFRCFLAIYFAVGLCLWFIGGWIYGLVAGAEWAALGWLVPDEIRDGRVYVAYLMYPFILIINVIAFAAAELDFHYKKWVKEKWFIHGLSVGLIIHLTLYYGMPMLSVMPGCDCFMDEPAWYFAFMTLAFPCWSQMFGFLIKKVVMVVGR